MPLSSTSNKLTSPQPVDGVTPIGSTVNSNRFSRLNLSAANPDWLTSLSQSQPRAANNGSSGLAAPTPVAMTAPASVDAPMAGRGNTSAGSFLSMFYRNTNITGHKVPQPPVALGGGYWTPPLRPVDVSVTMDATGAPATAEVRMISPIRREGVRAPMALGSDTWSALGSPAMPRAKPIHVFSTKVHAAPPPSVDSFATAAAVHARAPKPLWSELPMARTGRDAAKAPEPLGAPTLDAFRPASAYSTISSRPLEAPRPITTSPLRSAEPAAPAPHATAHPLVPLGADLPTPIDVDLVARRPAALPQQTALRSIRPVGEDEPPTTPVSKAATEPTRGFFRAAQVRPQAAAANSFAGLTFSTMAPHDHSDDESPPTLSVDLTCFSTDSRAPQQQQQVVAASPRSGFLNSLFSVSPSPASPVSLFSTESESETRSRAAAADAGPPPPVTKSATARLAEALMSFNALELAIGGGGGSSNANRTAVPAAAAHPAEHPTDYSSYFSSTAFDDGEDDSDESLDHLKRVVSIALLAARQQSAAEDGSGGITATTTGAVGSVGTSRNNRNGGGGSNTFSIYAGGTFGGSSPRENTVMAGIPLFPAF